MEKFEINHFSMEEAFVFVLMYFNGTLNLLGHNSNLDTGNVEYKIEEKMKLLLFPLPFLKIQVHVTPHTMNKRTEVNIIAESSKY